MKFGLLKPIFITIFIHSIFFNTAFSQYRPSFYEQVYSNTIANFLTAPVKSHIDKCIYSFKNNDFYTAYIECTVSISLCQRYPAITCSQADLYTLHLYAGLSQLKTEFCQCQQAEEHLTKAIQINPRSIEAYIGKGLVYLKMGKYSTAVNEFTKVININPNCTVAYTNRAWAFIYMGKIEEAKKDINKLLQLGKDNANIYNIRGLTLAMSSKWKLAYESLLKAKKLAPDNPITRFHLAFILYKTGKIHEAIKEISLSIELDTNIIEKQRKLLTKPMSRKAATFFAEEYLIATKLLSKAGKYYEWNNDWGRGLAEEILSKANKNLSEERESFTENTWKYKCTKTYPNRYFIGIYIHEYEELNKLSFIKNDIVLSEKLAKCFLGVPKENIAIIENPTLGSFKRRLKKAFLKIHQKDSITIIYYSGHGILDTKGEFHFLPKDASIESEEDLIETSIGLSELKRKLSQVPGKKVLMIDACRVNPQWKPAILMTHKYDKIEDITIIFSSEFGKISMADRKSGSSAFLSALISIATKGVENLDTNESGYIEISEIVKPLKIKVKKLTTNSQIPEIKGDLNIPLFPLN